ncbi:arylacetamide deacetylase-like [Bos mutus]|uniref:arylacetamide deacetylase-like n=1 Tax=Bos mutus TaxID=72004 RepID=UPI0038B454D9
MMGRKTILLLIVGVLGAYYVYTPLPGNIEELWKLMWVTTCLKTMTHLLIDDPDVKIKLKTQSLIYPALQSLDLDLPSYRENSNFLGLTKSFVVRLWSGYFTTDRSLKKPCSSINMYQWNQAICSNLLIGVLCSLRSLRKGIFITVQLMIATPFFQLFKAKTNKSRVKPKQIIP